MEFPKIDETKLPAVEKIIDEINRYVIDENCDEDSPEVKKLSQKLREVTGREKLNIYPFMYYSSYTTLKDAATMALLPTPQKLGLSDEELRNLIGKIARAEIMCSHGEAINGYFIEVLKLETGLDNVFDYLYNPDRIGMERHASIEEIIERIIADRKC